MKLLGLFIIGVTLCVTISNAKLLSDDKKCDVFKNVKCNSNKCSKLCSEQFLTKTLGVCVGMPHDFCHCWTPKGLKPDFVPHNQVDGKNPDTKKLVQLFNDCHTKDEHVKLFVPNENYTT